MNKPTRYKQSIATGGVFCVVPGDCPATKDKPSAVDFRLYIGHKCKSNSKSHSRNVYTHNSKTRKEKSNMLDMSGKIEHVKSIKKFGSVVYNQIISIYSNLMN